MRSIVNWVVKASKLCNLRCRYCYEWDDLDKRDRISLPQWERLLVAIREYHAHKSQLIGEPAETRIIWHGGEPLLLPIDYFRAVIDLQKTILGERALESGEFTNQLQTNLYSVSWPTVELLRDSGFGIGVSCDVIGGVRCTAGGKETEERTAANMDGLRARGVDFGGIVVIAGHTLPHLETIYEFYEDIRSQVRFLPLFEGGDQTAKHTVQVEHGSLIEGMQRFFGWWILRERPVVVEPYVDYLRTLLAFEGKEPRIRLDRRLHGEWALLVNTDGSVYQVMDAYDPAKALGNIYHQDIAEVLCSPAFAQSVGRDLHLETKHCLGCRFETSCSHLPLFETKRDTPHGRCALAYPLLQFMHADLRRRGFGVEFLMDKLQQLDQTVVVRALPTSSPEEQVL